MHKKSIFISYARQDIQYAEKIYSKLKELGFIPWLDKESIKPGEKWEPAIKNAIKNSHYFIALLSSNSVTKRGYFHKELSTALEILDEFPESEVFFIPVRLDACSPSHEKLQELQWLDLFPNWDDGVNKLLKALDVDYVHKNRYEYSKTLPIEILNLINDKYERWKELYYSARGGTIIKYDDFLRVNKHFDHFSEFENDKEKLAFLLRCAIQNGMGGQWGKWLRLNISNEKIVTPLFVALDGMSGWKPVWRSGFILELTFGNNLDYIYERIKNSIIDVDETKFALEKIGNFGVENYLSEILNNKEAKAKDARILLDEIRYFQEAIKEYKESQTVKDILFDNFIKNNQTSNKSIQVNISLDKNFDEFRSVEKDRIINSISKLVNISPNQIRVLKIEHGSVLLILEMPEDAALLLTSKFLKKDPLLSELGVTKVEIKTINNELEQIANNETDAKSNISIDNNLIKILFLSSNPSNTTRLRLDEEVRAIDLSLRQSNFRDSFELIQHFAVRTVDMQTYLLRYNPNIVHFSGHGSKYGELVVEDNNGISHSISIRALKQLFSVLKDDIKCVILNACYSEKQAISISECIDCVIGMSSKIDDISAISFSTAFYQALAFGRNLKTAFELGCVQIDLDGLEEYDIPKIISKNSNPEKMYFVTKNTPHNPTVQRTIGGLRFAPAPNGR